ncbi:MAG: hypothetical protein GY679_00950 [Mycoplasma sp.]|nr:hypothetical protein [Mycoplasma sp.]
MKTNSTHADLIGRYGSDVYYKALQEMTKDIEVPLLVEELERLCKKSQPLLKKALNK